MATSHKWSEIQPEKKWFILGKQKRFALWALYTSIGSMMLGFDFGIAGTATAYPAFQQVMGIPFPSQPSGYLIPAYVQSAWSGVSTGGDVLGVIISGQIMDRIGRKHTILVGSIFTAIGIGIQIAANDWKVFLAGRLINAIGFGVAFVVAPVWIGETVRPELRGLFLCLTNGSIVLGQFVLALVAYGTDTIDGKWSYQTLVVLQFAYVIGLLAGYPFFPESPFYLLKHRNNVEGARKSLGRIHGPRDPALIDAEVTRIEEMIAASDQLSEMAGLNGPPILQCLKGTNLKRTLISILPAASQQFIGAAFVLGYITYFLSLLGVTEYFKVSVALFVMMLVSNLSAFPLIEIAGRRPLLLYGMIGLTVIELIMGIMGVVGNAASLWVILVCIFLWAIFYQVSIGAVGFAVAAEVSSPPLRPITISLVGVTQGVAGWVIGFVSPYMINPDAGNLGAKVGFVFAALGLPLCVLIFFYIPETKGLSYDDMDRLFAAKVPPRHFHREVARLRPTESETMKDDRDMKVPVATATETERAGSDSV